MRTSIHHSCFHAFGKPIFCAILALMLAACGNSKPSSPAADNGGTDGGISSTDGGTGGGTDGGTGGGTDGGTTSYGSYGGGQNQPPARQVEPANPNNANLDTDCDGISDADELSLTYTDANGATRHTDPANPDTDGDGIPDGVEIGRTQIIEPDRCTGYFRPDLDPATTTNPVNRDTDGDGVPDGVEDLNHNGRVDSGEGDPKDPNNTGSSTVVAACSDANLAKVVFDRSQPADVQLATLGFTDKLLVTVNAEEKGWLYWNPSSSISAFALKKATVEANITDMESAGRAAFAAMGTISNPLVQTFTTWDAFPAMKATYNWAANGDAKALSNTIATAFAGSGASQWSGTAGVADRSWVLQVEYVRRSDNTADIVGAFVPASLYAGDVVLKVDDVVNGSAFAQSDDTASVQCEAFQAQDYSKLDILWVVDNSGSMDAHQEAVKNAGDAMVQALQNSTADWRMGLVTTSYYARKSTSQARDFTTDPTTIKCWFDQTCTGTGKWVGTSGNGTEKGFLSAQLALDSGGFFNGKIRSGAKLVLIVLTDTEEQSSTTTTAYEDYFRSLGAQVSGIVCQGPGNCSADETVSTRYMTVINDMGGVLASIADFDAGTNTLATLDAIIRSAVGSASPYVLAKAPISASFKVALQGPTVGTCGGATTNISDVPRSRADGFDYYAPANSILFYGACRPATGSQIALSYRYWVPGTCPADGCPTGCSPACAANMFCNESNVCVCSADCGGTCDSSQYCNTTTCTCDSQAY